MCIIPTNAFKSIFGEVESITARADEAAAGVGACLAAAPIGLATLINVW